jgi:hypothetical protein
VKLRSIEETLGASEGVPGVEAGRQDTEQGVFPRRAGRGQWPIAVRFHDVFRRMGALAECVHRQTKVSE